MATPVVANIIKTGAVLWVAPTGEAKPDETSVIFGAAWGGNWARVGYTKAPLTAAYASEEADGKVQEELAPVKRWRIGESLILETVLAELTAAYLQLAAANQTAVSSTAAGAGQKAYEETGLGGVAELTEKAWGFEGLFINASGDDEPVRLFVHKGTAMVNGALEFSKVNDDYTGVPIQIKALTDTTQTAGKKLALFHRVTAEASS
jgi:hypothetical protein